MDRHLTVEIHFVVRTTLGAVGSSIQRFRFRCVAAVRLKSDAPRVVVLPEPLSRALSLCTMDREMGEPRPVASGRLSTTPCNAFNARPCLRPRKSSRYLLPSPRSFPVTLSTRGFPPVAPCDAGLLKLLEPLLWFLSTPQSPSKPPPFLLELISPQSFAAAITAPR